MSLHHVWIVLLKSISVSCSVSTVVIKADIALYHFQSERFGAKTSDNVHLWRPLWGSLQVLLLLRSFFIIMCLFSVYEPIHVNFLSVLCLISGAAGQGGSPETVWGTEDLYGELLSWCWPHGCLQRGSRWRSWALRGRLILEGRSCGNRHDLGPEAVRLWTS